MAELQIRSAYNQCEGMKMILISTVMATGVSLMEPSFS